MPELTGVGVLCSLMQIMMGSMIFLFAMALAKDLGNLDFLDFFSTDVYAENDEDRAKKEMI